MLVAPACLGLFSLARVASSPCGRASAPTLKQALVTPLLRALPDRLVWYVLPMIVVLCSIVITSLLFGHDAMRVIASVGVDVLRLLMTFEYSFLLEVFASAAILTVTIRARMVIATLRKVLRQLRRQI